MNYNSFMLRDHKMTRSQLAAQSLQVTVYYIICGQRIYEKDFLN